MNEVSSFFYHLSNYDVSQATFYVNTQLSSEMIDSICHDLEEIQVTSSRASVGKGVVVEEIRSALQQPVLLSHWVSVLLASYVREVNERHFHFDITNWADELSILTYEAGDHYKAWHRDLVPSSMNPSEIRKLTIVMGLTNPEEYEGGEFQFYSVDGSTKLKLKKGQILVFPTTVPHRVTRVTSGVRKTIIGWYGGPPFK